MPEETQLEEGRAAELLAKEQHLADVYEALGVEWGHDPFTVIKARRSVPVFKETIGGALIDAARITTMAALEAFPEPPPPSGIVVPEGMPSHEEPWVWDCLQQAMNWLDAARELSRHGAPPATSLHVVSRPAEPPTSAIQVVPR